MAKSLLLSAVATAAFSSRCSCGGRSDSVGDNVATAFSLAPAIRSVASAKSSSCYQFGYESRKSRRPLLLAEAGEGVGDGSDAGVGAGDSAVESVAVESTLSAGSPEEEKTLLMRLILSTSIEQKDSEEVAAKVNDIIGSLENRKQGFQEDKVDGEWVLCFTRNSQGSPSLQKALPGDRGFQNFDVGAKKFFNIVQLWGGRVKVLADVSYEVHPEEPNRLQSTIVAAGLKLGPLRLPLPLTGRVGYLDFTYQDEDIRVTRGNRGGLFLHMRSGSSFAIDSSRPVSKRWWWGKSRVVEE